MIRVRILKKNRGPPLLIFMLRRWACLYVCIGWITFKFSLKINSVSLFWCFLTEGQTWISLPQSVVNTFAFDKVHLRQCILFVFQFLKNASEMAKMVCSDLIKRRCSDTWNVWKQLEKFEDEELEKYTILWVAKTRQNCLREVDKRHYKFIRLGSCPLCGLFTRPVNGRGRRNHCRFHLLDTTIILPRFVCLFYIKLWNRRKKHQINF